MTRGLDTNILLRWLLDDSIVSDDSPEQGKLVSDLVLGSNEAFFINHVVISETIWVLQNRAGRSKRIVAEVMDRLLLSTNVVVDKREVVEAALTSYRSLPGDFPDHLIGEINAAAGCRDTVTFDKAASKSPRFTELKKS